MWIRKVLQKTDDFYSKNMYCWILSGRSIQKWYCECWDKLKPTLIWSMICVNCIFRWLTSTHNAWKICWVLEEFCGIGSFILLICNGQYVESEWLATIKFLKDVVAIFWRQNHRSILKPKQDLTCMCCLIHVGLGNQRMREGDKLRCSQSLKKYLIKNFWKWSKRNYSCDTYVTLIMLHNQ